MLRIKSMIYLTGQANNNDPNSKSQTKKTIALNRFGIYNLRFIWNLVLGICDFIQQTPRQSRITLTWPKGPGFSGQNKNMHYPRLIKY
jgi:hypothetical protein